MFQLRKDYQELQNQLFEEKSKVKDLEKELSQQVPQYFIEKATRDFNDQLTNYKKKLSSLVSNNLDYAFLRELIRDVNSDVEINITLKDGTKINIRETEPDRYRRPTI